MGSISPVSSAHEPCTRRSRSPSPFLLHFFTTDFLNRLLFTVVVVVFTLTQLPFARAALQNATVDDEYGDSLTKTKPRFLPSAAGVWEGEECAGCRVKPDPTQTFRNTYLAATYRKDDGVDPVEISFQFTGKCPCVSQSEETYVKIRANRFGPLCIPHACSQLRRRHHNPHRNELHH